jgi:hypothetical protein
VPLQITERKSDENLLTQHALQDGKRFAQVFSLSGTAQWPLALQVFWPG